MLNDSLTRVATAQSAVATSVAISQYDLLARQKVGGKHRPKMVFTPSTTLVPLQNHAAVTTADTNDLFALTAHGLPVGTPVVFDTIASTTGITDGTIYYVTDGTGTDADNFSVAATLGGAIAGTKVAITTNGTANVTILPFVECQVLGLESPGVACVTADTNDLFTLTAHGFAVGTPVIFDSIVSTTGLTAGRVYYTTNGTGTDANNFSVSLTPTLAAAGTKVAITTNGTARVTSLLGASVLGSSGPMQIRSTRQVTFTHASDICNLAKHGLVNSTPVVFSGGGTLPAELTAGVTYFVTAATADTFKLATTPKNALDGTAIDITDSGSGVMFVQNRDGLLTAGGPHVFVELNPMHGETSPRTGHRYLGARFVVSADKDGDIGGTLLSAGAWNAAIVLDEEQGQVAYPVAHEV